MTLGVGVIGCGTISRTYFSLAPLFAGIEMRACADLSADAAAARAAEFGLRAMTVRGLLAADDIDIVANLTVPAAHYSVSQAILEAGKHVWSEKPLTPTPDEAEVLGMMAAKRGLRIGAAPDTFLGGAQQLARRHVDGGGIGRIASGTAIFMNFGMEHWHPDPAFFYRPGGGPVFDIGPYYIAALVNLIGPVRRVAALASTPAPNRFITSLPRRGETIRAETPTTIHALLEFVDGATVSLVASWDVLAHDHGNLELYGTAGSISVPDPNFFGGTVLSGSSDAGMTPLPGPDHPFGRPNHDTGLGMIANYRTAGIADMARAIAEDRPHRCSFELARHAVEVMTAILRSGKTREFVTLTTTCERPAALGPAAAGELMAEQRRGSREPSA